MDHLEDAVAIFDAEGDAAVRQPGDARDAARHARPAGCERRCRPSIRTASRRRRENRVASPRIRRPRTVGAAGRAGERLIVAHADRNDAINRLLAVMLVARNLDYLTGPIDAQLLAQAGRAQPAVGRRRARSQEPAQRDRDPPRAAQGQLSPQVRRAGRDGARLDHRRADAPPRRSRAGIPASSRGPRI